MTDEGGLRRTPLAAEHESLGGRMTDFHGWWMPIDYGSIVDEHRAVRTAAGLFDVSHMGEVRVEGPGAGAFLNGLLTNRMDNLAVGRARYSPMTDESGGTIDDLMVYRLADEDYLVVVNASNAEGDYAWIAAQAEGRAGVGVRDQSAEIAEVALQGPRAAAVLDRMTEPAGQASALGRFRCARAVVAGKQALLARTGYTGEDGFEVYTSASDAVPVWQAILREGGADGVVPAALGARDTLRLEAALPLYGQELTREVSPLAAGLERFVRLDKAFVGRDALQREMDAGVPRRVAGLRLLERGVPRTGYPVLDAEGRRVGEVTSGVLSPTLGDPVALALVPAALAEPGSRLAVEIRGRAVAAEVVSTPFYHREA
jgi:aminomethyltransferase